MGIIGVATEQVYYEIKHAIFTLVVMQLFSCLVAIFDGRYAPLAVNQTVKVTQLTKRYEQFS